MNREDMDQIVRLWGRDILRFCRITAGNDEDGDELYQQTMLTLWEKREQLDDEQNIKGYGISVALKLWKNHRRKIARRHRLAPQESLEALAEQGCIPGANQTDSPEEQLLRAQKLHTVRRMVEQMPERYRLPIQLHYAADLPIKAIAQVLKLPENTVKSRLRRGKELLRRQLEEAEYETSTI